MGKIKDREDFKKEFDDYINQFELIREFAYKIKSTPGGVVGLFYSIGIEALNNFEKIIESELKSNLGVSVSDLVEQYRNENYVKIGEILSKIIEGRTNEN